LKKPLDSTCTCKYKLRKWKTKKKNSPLIKKKNAPVSLATALRERETNNVNNSKLSLMCYNPK